MSQWGTVQRSRGNKQAITLSLQEFQTLLAGASPPAGRALPAGGRKQKPNWSCHFCAFDNYGHRQECYKCSKPKGHRPKQQPASQTQAPAPTPPPPSKPDNKSAPSSQIKDKDLWLQKGALQQKVDGLTRAMAVLTADDTELQASLQEQLDAAKKALVDRRSIGARLDSCKALVKRKEAHLISLQDKQKELAKSILEAEKEVQLAKASLTETEQELEAPTEYTLQNTDMGTIYQDP
eukprot:2347437-Amphidinium_carterae.3